MNTVTVGTIRMKSRDGKVERLAGVPLFAGCTRKELATIAKLTFETEADEGKALCSEGKTGLECYIIVEGEAKVTMAGTDMASIGPGGFFGEMALLDGGPRIATVTALTPMSLLVLARGEFESVLATVPAGGAANAGGHGRSSAGDRQDRGGGTQVPVGV